MKISAGNYEFHRADRTYFVQRVKSDYGDIQWILDVQWRDSNNKERNETGIMQFDTLRQVKAFLDVDDLTISDLERANF